MKCRNAVMIILSIMICLSFNEKIHAEELPFELKVEQLENSEEVLVSIVASEPVVMEAFTFSIMFDNEIYKLHRGYDEIQKGYEYTQEFREHQGSAMMLSNALENKVIFSGVNENTDNGGYEGVIARIALLHYNPVQDVTGEIRLEITALHMNGKAVELTEENQILLGEESLESQDNENEIIATETIEDVKVTETKAPDIQSNSSEISTEQNVQLEETEKIKEDENLVNENTILSSQAVTSVVIQAEDGSRDEEKPSATNSQSEKDQSEEQQTPCVVLSVLAGVVLLVAMIYILKLRKRRSE